MEEGDTPEETLLKQHRREKKDLQAQIQSMKNAVPKNDKKRRKVLTEEIAKLETDLNQKHEEELKQLRPTSGTKKVEEALNGVEAMKLEGKEEEEEEVKHPRVTKAQKRRDKKAAQEKERESRIAEAEVQNLQGVRHQEGLKLAQKLSQRGLQIKEISSDGHCMYRAVRDQLARRRQPELSVEELRGRTAAHMRSHAQDFLPFLSNANTGDVCTAEAFDKYCADVQHTAAWGGQLELQALTKVLQLPIDVIQADSPTIKIGEDFDGDAITLVYMRHAYGLGEHYNSVEQLKEPSGVESA